jgi:aromatic-L-amino-acid decarboxylase
VNDYRDWGIPLGRRFRALKLWFVIRSYGLEGLREKVRNHISYASNLASMIEKHPHFELLAPVPLNTVVFRYNPGDVNHNPDSLNERLLHMLNDSGKIYLTHTKLDGKFALRMVTSQTNVTMDHVMKAWELVQETASHL